MRRREFLKVSLSALPLAAMPGLLSGCGDDAGPDEPEESPGNARIAIVGAGLAGIHCAYRLAEAGVLATVYEASSRMGGRTFSAPVSFPDGDAVIELGGELIDTNHVTLRALGQELGIQLDDRFADDPPGIIEQLWWVNGARVPESTIVEQFTAVAPQMAQMVEMAESDDAAFQALDNTTLADWLDTHVPEASYPELHAVLVSAYRGEFGLEPEEQSALNMLYLIDYVTPDPFHIFGDSDERYHAHTGNQTFVTRMAGKLVPGQVQLDSRMVALHDQDGAYRLLFTRASGDLFEVVADHVILAIPFSVLREVEITAGISDMKREIIQNLGYGTNTKVVGAFTERIWRTSHNSTGAITSDLPLQQTWDSSIGQPIQHGLMTNFLGGRQGVDAGNDTAEEWFIRVVVPDLEHIFPGSQAAYVPGSARMMHWPTAPFHRGSYTCYRPGQWAYWGMEGVRERNIHFCGEHCSPEFQGWMEGAAETGAVVAAEILDDLGLSPSMRHQRILDMKLGLPHPCYHGDRQWVMPRWRRHRLIKRWARRPG